MIKEFIIELDELKEDITITYSESEQDYVVRLPEALTVSELSWVVDVIHNVIKVNKES